jgi:hypothetical protein
MAIGRVADESPMYIDDEVVSSENKSVSLLYIAPTVVSALKTRPGCDEGAI